MLECAFCFPFRCTCKHCQPDKPIDYVTENSLGNDDDDETEDEDLCPDCGKRRPFDCGCWFGDTENL